MENAGRSVVDELMRECPGLKRKRVLVLCGRGNNGGDGFVVARHLWMHGMRPEVFLLADPSRLKGDAQINWEMIRSLDLPVRVLDTPGAVRAHLKKTAQPDVIVDALFGTGLSKPVRAEFRSAVDWINRAALKALIVAVDVPSGLFADSASIPGVVVQADITVTFTALKPALVLPPAADCAGRVTVADIGSPAALLEIPEHRMDLIDSGLVRRALPKRPRDSHKGHFGHLFVVAGSRGKSGAALMTGLAALRSGTGLVTLWLPASLQRDLVGKVPELMTEPLPETRSGALDSSGLEALLSQLSAVDAVVVGPGLTTSTATKRLVYSLVRCSSVPVVLDADGINAFAPHPENLRNQAGQPVVITPHPGEMARLLNRSIASVQKARVETVRDCACEHQIYAILKGYQTLVSCPTGQVLINSSGNPGMATGGSGDILAGMAGCFVAQWKRRFRGRQREALADHLAASVYLHGLAGDIAAAEMGQESLIATDLLPYLPAAFRRIVEDR